MYLIDVQGGKPCQRANISLSSRKQFRKFFRRWLESERVSTVQEATDRVGISRSSFYKYKDDVFPFHDNAKGKTITFMIQMDDEPGLLSDVLHIVADYQANILTIHQSIPINGIPQGILPVWWRRSKNRRVFSI